LLQQKEQNEPMNKSNKKSSVKWNTSALKSLATKYDFSTRYIKQCITGERTPIFADRIKAEYLALKTELDNLLNNDKL
jgi:hypothetical protein